MNPHSRLDNQQGLLRGKILWLALLFFMALPGCGGNYGGVSGPAYYPGGGYGDGYIYHQSTTPAPISMSMLHDTAGPMANVSANHGSIKARAKAGSHK